MKYGLLLVCLITSVATTALDASQRAPKKRKRSQSIEQHTQPTTEPSMEFFAKMAKTAVITPEDFDDEMEEICKAPPGIEHDETDGISQQATIEVPRFRLVSSIPAEEIKASDKAEEEDSDKDEDTSDKAYEKRHKKETQRQTREVRAIQSMIKQEQRHKARLPRLKQCTNAECKKIHSIPPLMSPQDYTTIKENKHWTCSDNYWNVGDSFCDEIDDDGKKIEGGIIQRKGSPEEIAAAIQRGLAANLAHANDKKTSNATLPEAQNVKSDTKS
jgi:hypothetical protein